VTTRALTVRSNANRIVRVISDNPVWFVLLGGLILRLWLAHFQGNLSDLRQYEAWSSELGHDGPTGFYHGPNYKDYLPIYPYFLWAIGLLAKWFDFSEETWLYALKMPSVIADLASAYLLYMFLSDKAERTRVLAAATYLLLPPVLMIGPLWGQVDSLLALPLFGAVYLLGRNHPVAAAAAFTVAFMMKPFAAAALPFVAMWGVRDYGPRVWLRCVVAAFVVGLVLALPFFPKDPWNLFRVAYDGTTTFTFSASFTFNFFGAFGWFRGDDLKTWFIPWWAWGLFLTVLGEIAVLYSLRKAKGSGMLALGVGLSMLVFFTFETRMHERYMFACFLPLLAACFYLNRPLLWASFAWLSLVQFLQLYKSFFDPFFNAGDPSWLYSSWVLRAIDWSPEWWHRAGSCAAFVLSSLEVLTVIALIVYTFLMLHRIRIEPVTGETDRRLGRARVNGSGTDI